MGDKYAHLRPVRDRQCYRADGVPKARFTRLKARRKAAQYPGYHAYRCPECRSWHVGSEPADEEANGG